MSEAHTVGAAAELAGVSVRALHHYDEIGLVRPSRRSEAGYRLYTDDDLTRLARVVFYRELGFELTDIAEVLAGPETDEGHLRRQRSLVERQLARHTAMLTLIDRELEARSAGISLTPQERKRIFGGEVLVDHAAQARARWGHLPTAEQRRERTARYTEHDWERLRGELHSINQALADALAAGVPATDPTAMDLGERLRAHTERWFHDCSHRHHNEMAELYRTNQRSGRNYDDMAPGLSQYVHDVILANSARFEGNSPLTGE